MMQTILITGAGSGLGAAFVKAYKQEEDVEIIAVDIQFAAQTAGIEQYTVDISLQKQLDNLVQSLQNRKIDLIIHSAGIRGLVPAVEERHPDNVEACETMQVMDVETLERTFRINAIGTFIFIRALLPNLSLAPSPKVIVMSSRMGSVGNNQAGNKAAGAAYAYRASKAALNTIVRSFAVDVPGTTFVLCHPGRVETKLVKCKEDGAISADESVQSMLPLIESWNKQNSGRYYDRFGDYIEW